MRTIRITLAALALALASTGCQSVATRGGSDSLRPHKLKGPATAAMAQPPSSGEGDLKRPARSLLAAR